MQRNGARRHGIDDEVLGLGLAFDKAVLPIVDGARQSLESGNANLSGDLRMRIDALVTDDVDRLVQMLRLLADGNLAVGQLNVAAGAVDVAALDTYRTTYEGYARSLGEKRMMRVVAGVDSSSEEHTYEIPPLMCNP